MPISQADSISIGKWAMIFRGQQPLNGVRAIYYLVPLDFVGEGKKQSLATGNIPK